MMRTEEGISGIGPTNELNTGVIYHSKEKKRNEVIRWLSIRAKTSKECPQLVTVSEEKLEQLDARLLRYDLMVHAYSVLLPERPGVLRSFLEDFGIRKMEVEIIPTPLGNCQNRRHRKVTPNNSTTNLKVQV
jgi:hypothetical protein